MKLTQAGENLKELIRRCKNMARNLVKEKNEEEINATTDPVTTEEKKETTEQIRVVTENQLILNSLEGIMVLCNETRKDLRELAKQVGAELKE